MFIIEVIWVVESYWSMTIISGVSYGAPWYKCMSVLEVKVLIKSHKIKVRWSFISKNIFYSISFG